ncbi:MAG TPA: glycosyltransferase family 2 protein, partial [Thermomicrobiales bacterium]|nr:glycosyltransferase family 2 protein [Thermomicrobiales bacterium]
MTAESRTSDSASGATAAMPKLACSVIIPVHNKVTLTRACVNALLSDPETGVDREIIVVDDGSADLTPQLLAAFGDRIRVVRNEHPQGFAAACTAGIAASSHPNFVLLNNDTVPKFGWLSALARYAIRHPEAAVIGAKLLYPNDTIQHAGVVIGQNGFPQHIYLGFPSDHPAVNRSRRFPIVTAACCWIRRDDWEAMSGFDPAFRNGWEDVDFCLRLGEAGREVHYCHDAVVYHFESATRDPAAPDQRPNIDRYTERWSRKVKRDDFEYYLADGLIEAQYPHRYPIQLSISPLLAGVAIDDNKRIGDQLLFDRAKQVAVLLRNNILLNVRVHEAELRAQVAESRLRELEARLGAEPNGHVADAEPVQPDAQDAAESVAERAVEEALAEPPADDKPATQPILGRIERPGRTPDVVTEKTISAAGWAVSRAGIFAVKLLVDGVERATADYGIARPDVQALFPGYPDAAESGFIGEALVNDLADGFHSLTIRIIGRDGAAAEVTTTFE